jgi:hypothetical protein
MVSRAFCQPVSLNFPAVQSSQPYVFLLGQCTTPRALIYIFFTNYAHVLRNYIELNQIELSKADK